MLGPRRRRPRSWRTGLAALLLVAGLPALPAAALDCTPSAEREAQRLGGEVGGAHAYRAPVGADWSFALLPAGKGYDLKIFDRRGRDLSAATPPLHAEPNPRQLYGWHFRNAANSASNEGDVNAPQELRLFHFTPDVRAPDDVSGRGWLRVLDYGLADLEPGQKARMVYLKFEACLTWPRTAEPPPEPPPMTAWPELREIFRACGLSQDYLLTPLLDPPEIGGDFVGDDALDSATLVVRRADGKRGLAICRAGTWLDLVGFERSLGDLTPTYFDRMDWWDLKERGPVGQGADGSPPPLLDGDAIVLGMEEKSSVLLYWTAEGYRSYWQGD